MCLHVSVPSNGFRSQQHGARSCPPAWPASATRRRCPPDNSATGRPHASFLQTSFVASASRIFCSGRLHTKRTLSTASAYPAAVLPERRRKSECLPADTRAPVGFWASRPRAQKRGFSLTGRVPSLRPFRRPGTQAEIPARGESAAEPFRHLLHSDSPQCLAPSAGGPSPGSGACRPSPARAKTIFQSTGLSSIDHHGPRQQFGCGKQQFCIVQLLR